MTNKFLNSLKKFIDGDIDLEIKEKQPEIRRQAKHKELSFQERSVIWHDRYAIKYFKGVYAALSAFICVNIIIILLVTVS
ncbi:MAG: hypothetical protein RR162_02345, partial [Oscillospiraceae bacterium]